MTLAEELVKFVQVKCGLLGVNLYVSFFREKGILHRYSPRAIFQAIYLFFSFHVDALLVSISIYLFIDSVNQYSNA